MSLEKALITVDEADLILANYPDWLALSNELKLQNIEYASVYIQMKWKCSSIDFSDTTNLPAEIKEACAYYAYAQSKGNLYPTPDDDTTTNYMEITDKVGSLLSTEKFYEGGGDRVNALSYPDTLMSYYCVANTSGGSAKLTRV